MIAAASPVLGALFLLSCGFVLAKTGRDTIFFAAGGMRDLPLTYAAMAVLSMPLGAATLALMRRAGRRRACSVGVASAALGLLVVSVTLPAGRGAGLTLAFVAIPLVFGVLFSMVWLLVPDTVTGRAGSPARAYAWAGTASLLGGVAGGVVARWLSPGVSPSELLAIAAAVLSMSALLVWSGPHGRAAGRPSPATEQAPASDHIGRGASPPRASLLMAFGALTGIVGVLVEFQFYALASTGALGGAPADRFANLYLGMNAGALVALHATPLLQQIGGLGGTLMLLPASVSVMSSALWLGSGGGGRTLLRLAEGGLKASTHRVGWEQVFARVPREQRTRLKLTVDGMATRLGEGATGVGLFLAARSGALPSLATAVLVLAGVTWVFVTARIWRGHLRDGLVDSTTGRLPDS